MWITVPRGPPQMGNKYLKLPQPWKQQLFKVILHIHKRKRKWSSEEAPPPLWRPKPSRCLLSGQFRKKRKRERSRRDLAVE